MYLKHALVAVSAILATMVSAGPLMRDVGPVFAVARDSEPAPKAVFEIPKAVFYKATRDDLQEIKAVFVSAR
ncbi:MAG: hypothetical protein MMC33_009393 [Icmadophila ericetorum]|nr:hypothetical protein [Icmadophila ericetorum]